MVILLAGVVMLSTGFAAFSSELTISSSAIVRPDSSAFKVVFSSDGARYLTDQVKGEVVGDATVGYATIDNSGDVPTISDLTATFTGPGQSVRYLFYVYNAGAYDAYLTGVTFKNVEGENSSKVCTAIDSSSVTNSLMQSACNDINVTFNLGGTTVMNSTSGIKGNVINKGAYKNVVVTISYINNGNSSDGDFRVEFGDIGLSYSTVDSHDTNLISFSIDSVGYYAEDGMNWQQWVGSQYNSDGWFICDGYVCKDHRMVSYAYYQDEILSDNEYDVETADL